MKIITAPTVVPKTIATNVIASATPTVSVPTFNQTLPKISAPDLSLKSAASITGIPTSAESLVPKLGISTAVPFTLPTIPEVHLPGSGLSGILKGASPDFSSVVISKFKSIALGGGIIGAVVAAAKTASDTAKSIDKIPGDIISSAQTKVDSGVSNLPKVSIPTDK